MLRLVQLIVDGTVLGGTYAICALGMVVIFKATDVINIAQGELVMMAAFFGFTFRVYFGCSFALSFLFAIGLVILLSLAIERLTLRPLIKAPIWTNIITTMALLIILQSAARLIWGPEPYTFPPYLSRIPFNIAGIRLTPQDVAILSISIIYMIFLFLFFKYTRIGKGMRAVQMDKEAASLMGISVRKIYSYVWMLNAILVGTIGILLAPRLGVYSTMGLLFIKGFVVAVMGGFTSLAGSIVGGFLLGVVETLAGFYISSAMKDIVSFIILILILIVKPTGLFSESVTKRV
jgi:branched-chain amino acid transport system permease protein